MKSLKVSLGTFVIGCAAFGASAFGQLQKGDTVAVIGDSITEQRRYSVYIEEYLTMCQPAPDLKQTQFGWSGETAWGFESRMENDMLRFHATVATTCFGMNDGGYKPLSEERAAHYRAAQTQIIQKLKQAGVRFIVVGSPGAVDVQTFHNRNREDADMYNKTLAGLRDIAKEVAGKEGVAFADVFDPMVAVMTKAEEKFGKEYHIAGRDGIHPDNNGHLIMAYAFLKGLGCKGDIGTITVDLAGNKAEATDGHKVLSCAEGSVEIESTRYPFCFSGGRAPTDSTRDILPYLPFNDDLNRYMLVVKNAGTGKVKVTWGDASKEFDAEQLGKGINLAAEFLNNPFGQPFRKIEQQIQLKEEIETPLVKRTLHEMPAMIKANSESAEPLEKAATNIVDMDRDLQQALTSSIKPVKHTIKIEAVK